MESIKRVMDGLNGIRSNVAANFRADLLREIVGTARSVNRGRVMAAVVLASVPLAVYAADELYIFESGTTISSSAMNENFLNLDGRIATYEDAISVDESTGYVGIGTTSPETALDIVGDLHLQRSGGTGLYLQTPASDVRIFTSNTNPLLLGSNGRTDQLALISSGYVGIGTSTPSYKLHVSGTVAATSYVTTSDARLKTDIVPLEDSLRGVQCLQGVTYRWKDHSGGSPQASQKLQIGLIAQDVEACFPEAVYIDADGYKSVAYGQLVAPLIEAVKEQQDTISVQQRLNATQQKALRELTADLAATNARLAHLEARLNVHR